DSRNAGENSEQQDYPSQVLAPRFGHLFLAPKGNLFPGSTILHILLRNGRGIWMALRARIMYVVGSNVKLRQKATKGNWLARPPAPHPDEPNELVIQLIELTVG